MTSLRDTHRDLLERRRHSMNLVGPGDVGVHFDDCDRALAWLEPTGHWVDLGSGAGFPGLVFADRFPEVPIDLVESRRKRAVFLRQVLLDAGVGEDRVRVLDVRAESLPPHSYDGVVARAFAPPPAVLDHAAHLLRDDGTVVLFLQHDQPVPDDARFEVFHVERYTVDGKARRAVGLKRAG